MMKSRPRGPTPPRPPRENPSFKHLQGSELTPSYAKQLRNHSYASIPSRNPTYAVPISSGSPYAVPNSLVSP